MGGGGGLTRSPSFHCPPRQASKQSWAGLGWAGLLQVPGGENPDGPKQVAHAGPWEAFPEGEAKFWLFPRDLGWKNKTRYCPEPGHETSPGSTGSSVCPARFPPRPPETTPTSTNHAHPTRSPAPRLTHAPRSALAAAAALLRRSVHPGRPPAPSAPHGAPPSPRLSRPPARAQPRGSRSPATPRRLTVLPPAGCSRRCLKPLELSSTSASGSPPQGVRFSSPPFTTETDALALGIP